MFVFALLSVRMLLGLPKWIPTEWYDNKIDHFDPSNNKTFRQRFYTNLSFVKGANFSYALVYIGGESALYNTSVTSGSRVKLARDLGAAIFGLEHRFFGWSQPFADGGLSVDSLRYLSIEQALADLAEFIDVKVLHHPQAGPNVRVGVIGGSYPGSLSAWFREKYPHLAWASWASSAPVLIKNDFFEYDEYIADQAAQVSGACLTNLQHVFQYFHNATATRNDAVLGAIRRDYNFSAEQDNVSLLYVLVDILAGIVQYNSRYRMLTPLCADLAGNLTADVAAYHKWAHNWTRSRGETVQDIDLMMATEAGSSRSWSWMTCTEVGWFQTASGRLRSSFLNLTYFRSVCAKLYNLSILPDEREMNNRYGGDRPTTSRVFFLNGAVDPWSTMGVHVEDPSLDRRAQVIQGESHCTDLDPFRATDPAPLASAKTAVVDQMAAWLRAPNCTGKCGGHGRCYFDVCLCDQGWSGAECGTETKSKKAYTTAVVCAVAIPIVVLIATIIISYVVCRSNRTEKSSTALLKGNL